MASTTLTYYSLSKLVQFMLYFHQMTMILTRELLAEMLMRYINREIDLSSLVSYAEDMLRDADFEDRSFELIREILANIGLADVREFGLTWDDCYDYIHKLGYDVKVEMRKVV